VKQREAFVIEHPQYCDASEDDCDCTLARVVRNWFVFGKSTPEDFEDSSHDLLPIVRPKPLLPTARPCVQARQASTGWRMLDSNHSIERGEVLPPELVHDT
jgi:hypothetical protein